MRHRILFGLLALFVALPAAAQDDREATARALATEGNTLFEAGKFQEASVKYEESLKIYPLTGVYYNLGKCYDGTENWQGCIDAYNNFLDARRRENGGKEPAETGEVANYVAKCTKNLRSPITITSKPEGAQVAIGDRTKIVGATPFSQSIAPGTYPVFITKDGYKPIEVQIEVKARAEGKFHFDLPSINKTGKVRVVVNVREATIYIDGKNYGISPYLETPELDAGRHQIVVKKERYTSVNQPFEVMTDKTTDLTFQLFLVDPPPSWRSYLGWAGVSIGVVAIAGGIVAFKFAEDVFNDSDDFEQRVLLQNIGYGVGGGLLGLGTVLLIWEAFSDAVDKGDLIDVGERPFDLGILPTQGGVFFNGSVRF